jgi:2-polyprenyl-6-methoxyphenol hydroxylase-like FAD-dependent oxidoreductase
VTSAASSVDAPVLVVGAGPVGLVLAHELASHGVRCVLVDRADAPTPFPKMDITNGRSMELLARLGLADPLRAQAVGPGHRFDVVFATGLGDDDRALGRWGLPSVEEARRIVRFVNDGSQPAQPAMRCAQSVFEAELRRRSSAHPLIDFRPGLRVVGFDQDDDGVTTALVDADGRGHVVRSHHLVGCDGAASDVRRRTGIGLEGHGGFLRLALVHLRSRDLARLHRFGRFWHLYLAGGAVVIAQDERDTFTVHVPLPPGADGHAGDHTGDPVALVHDALGAPVVVDEVLLTSVWSPNLLVAERYRDGRVFLAGDAVHQVIPTGGYGMNTGVGDAVDLGWKLAAVANGWGGPVLLDSYEAERRPVAVRNRDRSARNSGVIRDYRRRAADPLIREDSERGERARADLAAWIEDNRGENESFGVELDVRHGDSPVVVADGTPEPVWDPRSVTPSTWPGARAPHVFLADGTSLFALLGPGFTLVDLRDARARAQRADLTDAWSRAAAERAVPFGVVVVDEPAVRVIWERDLVLVRPDHHVAWRSDGAGDGYDPGAVLDRVRGIPGPG